MATSQLKESPGSAFAKTRKKRKKKKKRKKRKKRRKKRSKPKKVNNKSEQTSKDSGGSKILLGLQGGYILQKAPSFGLHFGLKTDASKLIYFDLETTSYDLKEKADDGDGRFEIKQANTKIAFLNIGIRYFVFGPFSILAGAGIRGTNYTYESEDSRSTGALKVTGTTYSLVTNFGINTLWLTNSGLYIGADWIALNAPLLSRFSLTTEFSGRINDELSNLEKDATELGREQGARPFAFIRLMAGYGF